MTLYSDPSLENHRKTTFLLISFITAGLCSIYPVACFKKHSSREKAKINRQVEDLDNHKKEKRKDEERRQRSRERHRSEEPPARRARHHHSPGPRTARYPGHHHRDTAPGRNNQYGSHDYYHSAMELDPYTRHEHHDHPHHPHKESRPRRTTKPDSWKPVFAPI